MWRMRHARRALWLTALRLLLVAGVLGVLWVVLVVAPPWFVHEQSLEGLKAQNDVRTTLLQGLGGIALLMGAYFTYRQVLNSRAQLAQSYEQLRVAQEGQITDRFTRAIDQLGNAQLDVRLGGIYALHRIARDSVDDRGTISEVLTAFIRSHAPWPPRLPGQYVAAAPIAEVPELQVRAADVQACLKVLRRIYLPRDQLDLHAVDLRHANLSGPVTGPDLREANLLVAHLEGADLTRANLEGAQLIGADLRDANLKGADLTRANLEGALADERTAWPDGFNWRAAGIIVAGQDAASGGP